MHFIDALYFSLSISIYMYVCICIYVYIYTHIYIYIYIYMCKTPLLHFTFRISYLLTGWTPCMFQLSLVVCVWQPSPYAAKSVLTFACAFALKSRLRPRKGSISSAGFRRLPATGRKL